MSDDCLLVLHDRPHEVVPTLSAGCPGLRIEVAGTPAEVQPALAAHQPTVVFSIKHGGFPGLAHRPAVHHPSVRWVHVGGSGIEHLGPWSPQRVMVTSSAGVLAPFLAERSLAALLALSTGLPRLRDQQRAGVWHPTRFRTLAGRTAVIVGLGHTGSALARLLRPLGLHVVGLKRTPGPHPHADEVLGLDALDAVLPRADVLSVHLRLTPSTRGLLDARRLQQLPADALVLQASRGPVLDTSALCRLLDSGRVAGAWLDVFDTEPLPPTDPLWHQRRLLVTPHCADQVTDFPARFAARFVSLWQARTRGVPLPALVPPSLS